MKKVTNVNIGGFLIPMEDTALEAMQAFFTNMRHIHDDKVDREEIIRDAEERAAQYMKELLQKGAPSISELDIEGIVERLRSTKTTAIEAPEAKEETAQEQPRRLLRNTDDVMLGGVCSGFAQYFNIDPSIIRVLFAVFALSGWVVLGYLALWVFVPGKGLGPYSGPRIFRDTTNKVLGGVASGIANYFGWDVTIVRLAFLSPIILSIIFGVFTWPFFFFGFWLPNFLFHGSMTGTFLLAYLLLWILLPPSGQESIAHSFGSVARVLLYILAGVAIFATFVALIAALVVGTTRWPANSVNWADGWQQLYAYGTLFLFLGTPLVGMLVWLFRRMAGWNAASKYLQLAFAALWGLGILSLFLFISSLFRACPKLG